MTGKANPSEFVVLNLKWGADAEHSSHDTVEAAQVAAGELREGYLTKETLTDDEKEQITGSIIIIERQSWQDGEWLVSRARRVGNA